MKWFSQRGDEDGVQPVPAPDPVTGTASDTAAAYGTAVGSEVDTASYAASSGVDSDDETVLFLEPKLLDVAAERAVLVDLVIYAYDRAKSAGVGERLTEGLAQIGVTVVRPDGLPFDAAIHEAGGVEPTGDEALVGLVAETETPGFIDRGRVIREPVVVVYRQE